MATDEGQIQAAEVAKPTKLSLVPIFLPLCVVVLVFVYIGRRRSRLGREDD